MSKSQPTIVITGASGFLGNELVNHFARLGWTVRALVRDPARQTPRKHVNYLAHTMPEVPDPAIFKGADYLVHTAYIKEDKKHPGAFEANLEGSRRLVEASHAAKVKKNLFMSSMSAFQGAVSTYARQKLAIEELFDKPSDIIIRSGLIIGNGGLIKQIVSFMRSKHAAPLIDGGNQPLQVIAMYDMCHVIEKLLQSDLHGQFTIGTPEVYSYREFYLMLRDKLHIKAMIIPVPFWIPLLAIRTINFLHLPLGVTEDNLQGLRRLRAFETLPDLERLGVSLDPLDVILTKTTISR